MKHKEKWSSKKLIGLSQIWQLVNGVGRTHGLWFMDIFPSILHFIIKHKKQEKKSYEKAKI